ncbi:unnamed protein product [Arctogadus glacialis]
MSSRRKSSTPCMVRPGGEGPGEEEEEPMEEEHAEAGPVGGPLSSPDRTPEGGPSPREPEGAGPEAAEMDDDDDDDEEDEEEEGEDEPKRPPLEPRALGARGFVCKYCSFSSAGLGAFEAHVAAQHPTVTPTPLGRYHAAHPPGGGPAPQHPTPNGLLQRGRGPAENGPVVDPEHRGPPLLQGPPLHQGPHGSPLLQGPPLHQGPHVAPLLQGPPLHQGPHGSPLHQGPHVAPLLQGPPLHQGPHVAPLLQRPPNFAAVPKVAVPLSGRRYDPALDGSAALMASFGRFPYPTQAELSWLTAASRHPEGAIRAWFTTQRLKQGITWAPEEVEEARKKMFNGSMPPAHHTFTAPPPAAAAAGPRPRSPPHRAAVCSSYALVRPRAPEQAERPVMAVAPNAGDPRDKGLMAPPPPPPPLKDRPPVAAETKRPAATPLVASDPKRKHPGGGLAPPPGPRPPGLLPPSLARRFAAPPPPIVAPPYKDYRLPLPPLSPQEKHPLTHALLAPDPRPPPPAARRPSIIQPPRPPPREPRGPSPRPDKVLTPLCEANGVPRGGGDPQHPGGAPPPGKAPPPPPGQFPLLERMKGKTALQLAALEEGFLRGTGLPSHGEVDALAAAARLSRHEVRGWFLERRALRDTLEQALLNSMGARRAAPPPGPDRRAPPPPPLNGTHKGRGGGGGHLRSPPPPPIVAPPTPAPPPAPPLREGGAPGRWPSPEDLVQLEARTGLPRADLLRWFSDSRPALHRGGGAGPPGGRGHQGGRGLLLENHREGGATVNGLDAPEANASRLAESYSSSQQHLELQDWFSSRLMQQSPLEMKGGAGGGGGAGEVLGSWVENGCLTRGLEHHQQQLEG